MRNILLSTGILMFFLCACSSNDEIVMLPEKQKIDTLNQSKPTVPTKDSTSTAPPPPVKDTIVQPTPTPVINNGDKFNVIYSLCFDKNTTGDYKESEWSSDWNNPSWANHKYGYGKIIQEGSNKYLTVSFYAGSFLAGDGYQWHGKLPQGYDELYFSYRVKFSAGFNSSDLHGKLPGLSGGTSNGGGNLPTGTDGWSARYMFHGTGIRFYSYYPDIYKMTGDVQPVAGKKYYGSGPVLNPGFSLTTDVWYTVTQRVVMNTPGKADGLVEGFIDGKLCASQTGMRFRDIASLKIDRIFFSTFFGGSGSSPVKTEMISFDNFVVYTYKDAVTVARGNAANDKGTVIPIPFL